MGFSAKGGERRSDEEPEIGRVDETVECGPCGARWTNQTGEPVRSCPSCGRSGPMWLVRLDAYEPIPPTVRTGADLDELVTSLEEQARRLRSLHDDGWELGQDAGEGVVHLLKRYRTGEVRRLARRDRDRP